MLTHVYRTSCNDELSWCDMAGEILACVKEAQLSGRRDSTEMTIVISNILIDPIYLDMFLYVFKKAQYQSVTHVLETYMWVDASFGDTAAHAVLQNTLLLARGNDIVSEVRASYHCSIEIASSIDVLDYNNSSGQVVVSNAQKTDQYNISKLRSFLRSSVKLHVVYVLDVLIVWKRITLRKPGGWWDPPQVDAAVKQCFELSEASSRPWEMANYTNFATFDSGVKIHISGLFCPTSTELACVIRHIGPLRRDSSILCVAGMDVLHSASVSTGKYASGGLVGGYLSDFQQIEKEIHITQQHETCRNIIHIRHSATGDNYVDAMRAQKMLYAMHTEYTQHMQGSVIVDTSIRIESTYHINLPSL